jgi:VWFA-related protein
MKRIRLRGYLGLLVAGVMSVSSAGQQNADPRSLPTFRAETRIVLLDVIATDKDGKPVLDLKPAEVTILENGRFKELRAFELITPTSAPPAPAPATAPAPLPPGTFSNAVTFNTSKPLTVFLFDAMNTAFNNQAYARDKLVSFLDHMQPGQPVALFFLGRRLHLAVDFTTDPAEIKNALHHPKERTTSFGDTAPAEPTAVTPKDFGMTSLFTTGGIDGMVEQALKDVDQSFADLEAKIRCAMLRDATQALVRTLAGVPGRKNVIWIADHFPLDPSSVNSPCPNVDSTRTAELLATAQVAIYPVDASGLVTYGIKAEDNITSRGRNPGPAYRDLIVGQSEARANKVGRMRWLADMTGGKAYSDRNDLDKVFADSFRESSIYYTLAYYADKASGPDPRARHIAVKVTRPDVQLRYRTAYVPIDYSQLTPQQRSRDFGVSMDPENPISTALPFRATVRPAVGGKVPVQFRIDGNTLMYAPQGADHQLAQVDCVAAVYRRNKLFVKDFTASIEGSLAPAAYERVMREGFPCEVSVELPPGEYLVRFGVRDEQSGITGTANGKLTVPAGQGQ